MNACRKTPLCRSIFSYFCLLDIEGGELADEVADGGRFLENLIRARYLGLPPKDQEKEVEWRLRYLFQSGGFH